ncbi:OLC1v1015188C1 [Oldenlandia corymbosa var. corymbosa]|uniref:Nuclear pore complex protein n=1 Tax=Oldenlandia corymbosa var. corymbosa TaxID=529605 RepID=A0AAV1E2Y2_OLDCO|nr:OLC1v1015188C1 [Oldenlandia corymbosa var. corymbosa]
MEDVDMDASPSHFDPQDLSSREQFRRYGKWPSSISPRNDGSASRLSEIRSNAALFLEDVKQEVESLDTDHGGTPSKTPFSSKRRLLVDDLGQSELDFGDESVLGSGFRSLKAFKLEEDAVADDRDTTCSLFASLLDSTLQGLMPIPDLILRFENACREVSESIRSGSTERHRIVEDKLMRQKARLLLDEAASWSLLWYLFGKGNESSYLFLTLNMNSSLLGNEEIPEVLMFPRTSHLEACEFVLANHTAQLCLRIVQWLEGLASKALDLDNKVRGSHVGTYLPKSGIWHNTQRHLKKGASNPKIVHHLDFDASTRECAQPLSDDRKHDESFLEDVWSLLRAGRLDEACSLCRSGGQPWRAATLCPFGGYDLFPSIESLVRNGKNRILQAVELESGIGHQFRLWKWASYCASEQIAEQDGGKYESAVYASRCSNLKRMLPICTDWESACWAMAKSWLDFLVDMELTISQPGGVDQFKSYEEALEKSPEQGHKGNQQMLGPDTWPLQVLNQQPRQLDALLQKLHSSDTVHEAVTRACKEQQRQIQMSLMLGDIPHLLDLIWSWISPSQDHDNLFRPHGDPQMMRFGAHLVLVLRYLLADQMKGPFVEKTMITGDLILHMYTMYLFTKKHEELVGIYASKLARHRCVDLFVHMMELRLNSSVHVRYKLFLSAIEYLPFSAGDDSKGSFEEVIERILSKSRETSAGTYDGSFNIAEHYRQESLRKAMVIQWLCFTPPSTIKDSKDVSFKLLLRALMHSNILFREFALISMWRVPAMPIGAHTLLGLLAEPLKDPIETLLSTEDSDVSENLREFQDWNEYYSCDATYRNWLKVALENSEVPHLELSVEEEKRVIAAAKETLESSLLLLKRKENPWLVLAEDHIYESKEPVFLELHATATLCLPSGECISPDATLCTTLTSALYSSLTEEEVLKRDLIVNVSRSERDEYSVEVALRCLAAEGDGLGPHELNDGGILSTVLAAGFKGELVRFEAGVTLEISRIDAWYSNNDGVMDGPATYILRGLCRRCCIPEVALRCMQVSVSLVESGNPPENHDELIDLVSSPETSFLNLFSQRQMQEFLLFEREYSINMLALQEATIS